MKNIRKNQTKTDVGSTLISGNKNRWNSNVESVVELIAA
jgi:hypothetical protein